MGQRIGDAAAPHLETAGRRFRDGGAPRGRGVLAVGRAIDSRQRLAVYGAIANHAHDDVLVVPESVVSGRADTQVFGHSRSRGGTVLLDAIHHGVGQAELAFRSFAPDLAVLAGDVRGDDLAAVLQ